MSGTFGKWMWIELVGFDSAKKDFGVREFIDNAGFVPDVMSFLLSSPDFIHQHDPAAGEVELPWDVCTYGGRNNGKDDGRPRWTSSMLKGLVAELRKHGTKVFCSVFSTYFRDKFHKEWVSGHQELLAVSRDGAQINYINPLGVFKNGGLYEDFFVGKLAEVLRDYDFDGFHCADGRNHYTLSLCAADYSDGMVAQFADKMAVHIPRELAGGAAARAKWIWQSMRAEWIRFHVERWTEHVGKIVEAVHGVGKKMIFQTAWTRDPFEAVYRYGIDYSRIAATGVDWFTVECAAGTNESGAELGMNDIFTPDFFYRQLATILLTKPAIKDVPMAALHFTHDMMENWEILRHMPAFLQKEAYFYPNLFCHDKKGRLARCAEGFLVCLSNGIARHEWAWMRNNWENSFAGMPEKIRGATLVWSDSAVESQVDDYINTRSAPTHSLLWRLLLKGAPIFASARVEDIENVRGPIVVINHHLLAGDELDKINAYKNGPKILIGKDSWPGVGHDFGFEDVHPPERLALRAYGAGKTFDAKIECDGPEDVPSDLRGVEDPLYYCQDLYTRKVSDSFLRESARAISLVSNAVRITNSSEATILAMETGKGRLRLIIGNNRHTYSHPEIDVGSEIAEVKIVTDFPYKTIVPNGSKILVRVPGKGVVALDVILKLANNKKD